MPRRESRPRSAAPFKYMSTPDERAIDVCETSDETGRVHRVEPEVWPPPKKRGKTMDDDPASLRCVHCGSVCLVYPDNDPEQSGIEVIPPKKAEKAELAGKK